MMLTTTRTITALSNVEKYTATSRHFLSNTRSVFIPSAGQETNVSRCNVVSSFMVKIYVLFVRVVLQIVSCLDTVITFARKLRFEKERMI